MTLLDRLLGRDDDPVGVHDIEVLWLGEADADDPARTGGKAANLSRLAERWPVPPGFCLPVELHRRLADADRARDACLRSIASLVAPAYRRLCDGLLRRAPVAVRSSAPDEDAAATSFAGQHETVLDVVGTRSVARAVQRCCDSAGSQQARDYRKAHDLDHRAHMAVLVQELVDADVSGVAFSANPVTGDRDEVMINASYGLGSGVVDGIVTPDTYVLSRGSREVIERSVADKDVAVVRGRRGPREVEVTGERRRRPALDDDRCREVARLTTSLARHMGWPTDVEFAYRDGRLFLLQCRPITTLPGR